MPDHLHRSRDDRMLAGVAGGLAEMWDADPSVVRIVWAFLMVITGGIALVVYVVMAIVVPEDDGSDVPPVGGGWRPSAPTDAPGVADAAGVAGAVDAQPGSAPAAAPPAAAAASAPPTYWMPGSGTSRADRRAARRAARRQRRDSSAPIVFGVFLVLLGGFFLVREWLPQVDWDWFWPGMLIALGVLLLLLALGRRDDDPGVRS